MESFSQIRLHLTNRCNLACSYCFERESCQNREVDMSPDVLLASLNFLKSKLSGRNVKVVFFGGEPSLRFDLVKFAVVHAKKLFPVEEYNLQFAISTNGTLLDDNMLNLMAANDFGILFSYDGSRHDVFRKLGKFDAEFSLAQIRRLFSRISPERVALAATVHHKNTDILGMVSDLIKAGAKHIKLGMNMVAGTEESLTEDDFASMCEQVPDIMCLLEKYPHVNVAYFSVFLDKHRRIRLENRCSSCWGELTVDTNGDVYPCSVFAGDGYFRLGNVLAGSTLDVSKEKLFLQALNKHSNFCKDCEIKALCPEPCLLDCIVAGGNKFDPLAHNHPGKCAFMKKIVIEKLKKLRHLLTQAEVM